MSKKEISFNEHFPFIWKLADSKGMSKTKFLDSCGGFQVARFSAWMNELQNLTAESFIKLLEGLNLTCENYETKVGKRLSEEQREECQFKRFIKSQVGRAQIVHVMKKKELQEYIQADMTK